MNDMSSNIRNMTNFLSILVSRKVIVTIFYVWWRHIRNLCYPMNLCDAVIGRASMYSCTVERSRRWERDMGRCQVVTPHLHNGLAQFPITGKDCFPPEPFSILCSSIAMLSRFYLLPRCNSYDPISLLKQSVGITVSSFTFQWDR